MGYGSAGVEIFDPVARALIHAGAPDDVITETCTRLIKTLTDQDWDTLEDSIQEFADQPAVLAAFEQVEPETLARFRRAVPELFGPVETPAESAAIVDANLHQMGSAGLTNPRSEPIGEICTCRFRALPDPQQPDHEVDDACPRHGDDGELEDAAAQDDDGEDPF